MKNDLDWPDDKNGFYSAEKILEILTLIISPRSMAGLNLNPNHEEFQLNETELMLERICKKTYLMDSGWDIIRQLGPAEICQQLKSTCQFQNGIPIFTKFD